MKLELEVKNKFIGKIFGKNGRNIKRLSKENSVKIKVSNEVINDTRKITLYHFFSFKTLVKVKFEILLYCLPNQKNLGQFVDFKLKPKEECPICLEEISEDKNFTVTSCGHKFHTSCLLKCIKNNNSCPFCRKELVEKEEKKKFSPTDIENIVDDTVITGIGSQLFDPIILFFINTNYPGGIKNFLLGPISYVLLRVHDYLEN